MTDDDSRRRSGESIRPRGDSEADRRTGRTPPLTPSVVLFPPDEGATLSTGADLVPHPKRTESVRYRQEEIGPTRYSVPIRYSAASSGAVAITSRDVVRRWLFELAQGSRTLSKTELAKNMKTSRARLNTASETGSLSPENIDALGAWLGSINRVYEELRNLSLRMESGEVSKLTALEIESLNRRPGRLPGRAGTVRPVNVENPSSLPAALDEETREPGLPTTRPRSNREGTGKRSR
jgi:hypothetical protein